nr:hypothetical protein L204_01573 [Cryptococcus depauperatus CBS 7855]
MFLILEQGVQ